MESTLNAVKGIAAVHEHGDAHTYGRNGCIASALMGSVPLPIVAETWPKYWRVVGKIPASSPWATAVVLRLAHPSSVLEAFGPNGTPLLAAEYIGLSYVTESQSRGLVAPCDPGDALALIKPKEVEVWPKYWVSSGMLWKQPVRDAWVLRWIDGEWEKVVASETAMDRDHCRVSEAYALQLIAQMNRQDLAVKLADAYLVWSGAIIGEGAFNEANRNLNVAREAYRAAKGST